MQIKDAADNLAPKGENLVLGVPFKMKGDSCEWGAEDIAKKVMAPFEWLVCI
jgi:hypothetical protein